MYLQKFTIIVINIFIVAVLSKPQDLKGRMKKSISLVIPLDKNVLVKLKKVEIEENGGVQVGKAGVDQVALPDKNSVFCTYENKKLKAFFTVMWNSTGKKVVRTYFGDFEYQGHDYTIYPKKMNLLGNREELKPMKEYKERKVGYVIYKDKPDERVTNKGGDDKPPTNDNNESLISPLEGRIAKQLIGSNNQYTVEIFCFIDNVIYKRWMKFSNNQQGNAIQNIRFYYAHAINGVNDQYSTIKHNEFSVVFKLAGYYMAKSPDRSSFVGRLSRDGVNIDGESGLGAFKKYVKEKGGSEKGFSRYDVIALFTGLDMGNIAGIAYLGAVCTMGGVAIIKDLGHFSFVQTIAHEIAHSLGVEHDGEGDLGGRCPSSDQYIMAPVSRSVTGQLLINSHTFSRCSVAYMKKHLDGMNKKSSNCLVNSAAHSDANVDSFLREYPGQRFDADTQCKMLYGSHSKFCDTGGDSLSKICEGMYCVEKGTSCAKLGNQRALKGTACGKGMWCKSFQCVRSRR